MVKLCLRPIESDLPATAEPTPPAEVPPDEQDLWRDSSLELERGLDVIEVTEDIANADSGPTDLTPYPPP